MDAQLNDVSILFPIAATDAELSTGYLQASSSGAKGVLLGRAWAYALAAAGEAGVTRMLAIIEAEMRVAMALTGVTRISDIDQSILAGVQS